MSKLLYGKDDLEGVVGLYPRSGNEMVLQFQDGSQVESSDEDSTMNSGELKETRDFYPFFHTTDEGMEVVEEGFSTAAQRPLRGNLHYNNLVVFHDTTQMHDAKNYVKRNLEGDHIYIEYSPTVQFLQQTGITTYGGMVMDDLHRMQVDIEVYSKDGFPSADRPSDEVIIVSCSDNQGWVEVLHTSDEAKGLGFYLPNEKKLLQQLVKVIHRKDPDTIEGHNILGFDLPYLRKRSEMHGVPFRIGRDNTEPRWWESQKEFAERDIEYENYVITGRSVVDSYFLANDYDTYARDLPSYGLKEIAKHFGITADNREYVPGHKISQVWDEDPKRLLKYAADDAIETREVVEALGNASFALTKIVPATWQEAIIMGTSSTLESIMVREYLRRRHSIPNGSESQSFKGAYTEIFERGVFENCAYADVSSLYPSIMLNWDVTPKTDQLGVFKPMLEQLTDLRLEHKQMLKELDEDSQKYEKVDAQQAAEKILINSAYGMLGFPFAAWSDLDGAAYVTYKGREILKDMIVKLDEEGARVVSCDTDGALFVIPENQSAEDIISSVDEKMPEGIEIDEDYTTPKVVTYKAKNYAKLKGDKLDISGASLMGRQKEPFLRQYIQDQLWNLINEDPEELHNRHERAKQDILEGNLSPEELCRTQRLKKTMQEYKRGIEENENKHPLGQYEVALRKWEITGIEPKMGDTVRYYVRYEPLTKKTKVSRDARLLREYDNDEDTEYYLDRLNTTSELFHDFFDNPETVFDPSVEKNHDLFGGPNFDNISIKTEKVNDLP